MEPASRWSTRVSARRKNRKFYGNDKAQSRWIKELVNFTEDQGLDGINVDVELLPADLVPAYGAWVGRLRSALRERLPDAQVSVSTTGGLRGAAMAAAANAAGADRIFLMGYDYHWPGSEPGASAPMDRLDGEDRDLPWSLDRYADLGVPPEKTILGLPLYGYTWPVSGPGIGAPSLGRGDTWVPRRNLRVFEDESFDPEYNATESVEFYAVPDEEHGSWDAVYYDSPRSLTPKLALANERGLAGAGFWAIGYERGLAGLHEADRVVPGGEAAGRQARGVGRSAARWARARRALGRTAGSLGEQRAAGSPTPTAMLPLMRKHRRDRERTLDHGTAADVAPPRSRVPASAGRSRPVSPSRDCSASLEASRGWPRTKVPAGRGDWLLAEIRPVGPDHPRVPARAVLWGPRQRLEVDVDDPEPRPVPEAPFEVVHEAPHEVPAQVGAGRERLLGHREMPPQVVDPARVVDCSIGPDALAIGHPVLGDVDGDRWVVRAQPGQLLAHRVGHDAPAHLGRVVAVAARGAP